MGHRPSSLFFCALLVSCGGIAESTLLADDESGAMAGDGDDDGDVDIDGDDWTSPEPIDEPEPDCSGEFGEPSVLIDETGWIPQAITPSSNELELFYGRYAMDRTLDDSGKRLPTLRTRTSVDAAFGEPMVLPVVAAACEQARGGTELAALDLSRDGKRLYLGCSEFRYEVGASGPLLVFEREEVGDAFDGPWTIVGEVGISLGLTTNELTAFGTTLDPSVPEVVLYRRTTVPAPFEEWEVAPGAIEMGNPEPAPDGGELWGIIDVPGTTKSQLARASYNVETQAFEQPVPLEITPPSEASDISPALSADCRSLYFVRYSTGPLPYSQIMIARR